MRSWSLAAAALLLLAGCLSSGDGERGPGPTGPGGLPSVNATRLPDPGTAFAAAQDWEHGGDPAGHSLREAHAHSFGMELVGYNPLTRLDEGGEPLGHDASFIALDAWWADGKYYACVAHYQAGPGGGATLVDVTDPTSPTVLATVLSGMQNSDCQFTDDGRFLLVGSYLGATPGVPGAPPPVGDLMAEGVLIYDVSDKANPRFLRHDTTGAGLDGYHNVFTAKIGGTNYVFQTYTGTILSLDEDTGELTPVGKLPVADHDLWVGRHPLTQQWIAVTGAGPAMAIYGVDDPSRPVPLAEWVPSEDRYTGWHRQWPVDRLVEGRALMLVAGELDESWYTVLDFTDPTAIAELGHWRTPKEPRASAHEFEQWDGYFATANYHDGVWMLDIGSLQRAQEPVTLGYYLPHEDPLEHGGTPVPPATAGMPNVWGTAMDDRGLVYAADRISGLYVLGFGATPPLR
jgi:hypothetical protein